MAEIPWEKLFIFSIVILFIGAIIWTYVPLAVKPPEKEVEKPAVPEPYVGQLNAILYVRDSFTGQASSLELNCTAYRVVGEDYIDIGNVDSDGLTVTLTKADNGKLLLAFESDEAYVDKDKIVKAMEGYSPRMTIFDIDNDGNYEYVLEVQLTTENLVAPETQVPVLNVFGYVCDDDQSISLTQPSDVSGIGTGLQNVYVTWKLSWSSTEKAVKIARIEIVSNASDLYFNVLQMNSIIGDVDASGFEYSAGATTYTWTPDIGVETLLEPYAILIKYPETESPDFAYFKFKFQTNFQTDQTQFQVTLKITIIFPDGSTTVLQDTVNLNKS